MLKAPSQPTPTAFCELGRAVIETEARAIAGLTDLVGPAFATACQYMLQCQGRVVVIGMGKSGHIGGKIAATLASTGTPAFFVHPGEASHGDLGMITAQDVVLAISNSGNTEEILNILPLIKRLEVPLISLTGQPDSELARMASINVPVGNPQEACPLGLAPTSSTTATLVMGDALAIALLEARGFTAEDFARSHPGGSLGRRLLIHVQDLMHEGSQIPQVNIHAKLTEALMVMTQKGFGLTLVLHDDNTLAGIYTDGDLRRTLDEHKDLHALTIREVMSSQCKTIRGNVLAAAALQQMEQYKITALVVTDDHNQVQGILHMHDLLRAKVV